MAQVRLILTEDVDGLGHGGELVSVKPGYAWNFLVPKGKAMLATEAKVQELEHAKRVVAEKLAREKKSLQAEKDRVEQISLAVEAQAGEEGKLFGSVTAMQIAELLGEKGLEIDRRKIDLKQPIKTVGVHAIPVKLHREVIAEVKLTVTGVGAPEPERDDTEDDDRDSDERRRPFDDDDDE